MICAKLASCIDALEVKTERKYQADSARKKKHQHSKIVSEETVKGNPCADKEKQKQCVEFLDSRSRPHVEENEVQYEIQNSKELEVLGIHVDGGVAVGNDTKKCDYLLVFRDEPQEKLVFIELKSKHLGEAIVQMTVTMELPEIKAALAGEKSVYGRIVTTARVPNLRRGEEFDKQKALAMKFKSYHGNLKIRRNPYFEAYSALDSLYE